MQRAPNDPVAGEPGARHGACRSKMASSAARHGKRRDGKRRVAAERAQRAEPPGRVFGARPDQVIEISALAAGH